MFRLLFLHIVSSFLYTVNGQDYHVLRYGAVGDGETDDTNAIRAACLAAERSNGGRIIFDEGYTFLTGCFNISSNVVLDVRGKILGSQKSDGYNLVEPLPW